MTGNIDVKNGVAQTNNTEALLDIGNVGITGTANLVNQALNLRITAVLSNELSQKAGGNNICGYAKTVLANNQGELVIPATVTGTFQHPQFAPDVQQLAQMKLKGLVADFNNPAAAVSGLLGNLANGKGGGGAQSENPAQLGNPSAAPNPLQQLQGIFGKKETVAATSKVMGRALYARESFQSDSPWLRGTLHRPRCAHPSQPTRFTMVERH